MEYRLKDIRESLDLTQNDVAKNLDITRANYSMWEIEKLNIPLLKYNNFCNRYGYSMDYVANLTNNSDIKHITFKRIDEQKLSERLSIMENMLNLSASAIANMLGIGESTYYDYKNPKHPSTIQTLYLKHLAKETGFSMDWIVGRSDEMYTKN